MIDLPYSYWLSCFPVCCMEKREALDSRIEKNSIFLLFSLPSSLFSWCFAGVVIAMLFRSVVVTTPFSSVPWTNVPRLVPVHLLFRCSAWGCRQLFPFGSRVAVSRLDLGLPRWATIFVSLFTCLAFLVEVCSGYRSKVRQSTQRLTCTKW